MGRGVTRVDGRIAYLNTDLDLTSPQDLTGLAGAFGSRGMYALHVARRDDGMWHATLETDPQHGEPERTIAAMLAAIESLGKLDRAMWDACTEREFNIGYDCGDEPWAFNQGLSFGLLGRIASARASLRITLYPNRA